MIQLHDRIILVTGATDGIGKQTALELARQGAQVILHGRNADRVKAVVVEIQSQAQQSSIETVCADFSSLHQVREMAE